jgi:AcrR family transcriptional regulator
MNPADLKYQQRLKTRARILDAARALVAETGYAALTMRRLAQVVNYSPAALYLHFASREEIALTLRDEARLTLAHALLVALPPPHDSQADSPPATAAAKAKRAMQPESTPLLRLARAWLTFARAHPHQYQLALLEPLAALPAPLQSALSPAMLLDAIVAALQAAPALVGQKARRRSSTYRRAIQAHAELAMATLHGLASLALLQPELLQSGADHLLDAALPALERGLHELLRA